MYVYCAGARCIYYLNLKVWETLSPPIWQPALPAWTKLVCPVGPQGLDQLQPYNVEEHAALKRKDNDDYCPDDEVEIVVVAQSRSAPGGGWHWQCTIAAEAAKRNQLSATKPFLFPSPPLINRLFPGCKTAGFLKLVWKQEILRGCCSVALLQQYPVFFKQTVQKKQRIQSYGF